MDPVIIRAAISAITGIIVLIIAHQYIGYRDRQEKILFRGGLNVAQATKLRAEMKKKYRLARNTAFVMVAINICTYIF